jgi:hypothetical protein
MFVVFLAAAALATPRAAHPEKTPTERCSAWADLALADGRAALTQLGMSPDASFDARFRSGISGFPAACEALSAEQLACLETAENAIAAVGSCKINEGKPYPERLLPAMLLMDNLTWQVHRQSDPSDAHTKAALAALAGTWTRNDGSSVKTLVVSATGEATYTDVNSGKTETHTGAVAVLSPAHIEVKFPGWSSFNWGFHVNGDRALFSNQTGTGPYPIAASGQTRFAQNGQAWLITDVRGTPTCQLFGPRLEPLPATCVWSTEGGTKVLVLTRGEHYGVESASKSGPYPLKIAEVDGQLLPVGDSMIWTRAAR